jgi:hypothetical protein
MVNKIPDHNNYLEYRWKPEHTRFDQQAQRYQRLSMSVTGVALVAAVAGFTLGPINTVWQMALFGVALVAMAIHVFYDFRDHARRYRRVADALRHEREMFEAGVGVYAEPIRAHARLERRCEAIIGSGGASHTPLFIEDDTPTTLEDNALLGSSRTASRFSNRASRSPFTTRSTSTENDDDDDDYIDDDDEEEDGRTSSSSRSRFGRSGPFSSRSSSSPFSSRSSSNPFTSSRSSSPFSKSSRFSGNRPIGSSGGMRREENDDPALAGIEGNGNTGVRFAAYYPKELTRNVWHPVKAYAMMGYAQDAVAADAEGGDIDKLPTILFDRNRNPRYRIPEGAQVTVIPKMKGFQFNPQTVNIGFYRTWHRFDFEMRAVDARLDEATNGYLTFMVNGLIVADVPLSVYVGRGVNRDRRTTTRYVFRKPYRTVYASFADEDKQLAERLSRVYDALGMYTMRDVMAMRADGDWTEDLLKLVDEAEIFQLFWSRAAAGSDRVTHELERALTRSRSVENFIRPVTWEQPSATLPEVLEDIKPAYMPEIAE